MSKTLAYLYSNAANESLAETFLAEQKIGTGSYKKQSALQSTLTEYVFSIDDTTYENFVGIIQSSSYQFQISRQRMGIGAASQAFIIGPTANNPGSQATVGTTAVNVLTGNADRKGAFLQADSANTGVIRLVMADAGVSPATTSKGVELAAGAAYEINGTNLYTGDINAIATASGQKLNIVEY